jgi:subtilisin family serine protease
VSYAQSKGALVVAAAGNNSSNAPFYPASYPGVLSVAASDQFDKLFSYSDFGSWVDVAAPGSNYTVAPSGNSYNFGGTSSASPLVAGIAGLLLSAVPAATAADVAAAITQTTDPLTAGAVASGRVNAASAMAAISGGSPTASPSPTATATASPSPTATATASPTPTATTASPARTATTAIFSGNVPASGSKSYSLSTSGGVVTASVSGVTADVTIALVSSTGSTVASAAGGSGTAVSGTLPPGPFTIVVSSAAARAKFRLSVAYYA